MTTQTIRSAVVLGSNGGFGRIFARRLIDSGVSELHGIDLQTHSEHEALAGEYISGSVTHLNDAATRLLKRVDCVLACIPETALLDALPVLDQLMAPDRLVIDIASVKSPIAAAYERHRCSVGYVGLHPMFAPIPDFTGRGMAMVVLRANERSDLFEAMVRSWGVDPCLLSAAEHDQTTACIQALPHAALIAFGAALVNSGIPFETMWKLATPIHKTMLGLLSRVTGRDQSVHYSIQADNPFAAAARHDLQARVVELSAQVKACNEAGFCEQLQQTYAWLKPAEPQIRALATGVVDLTRAVAAPLHPEDPAAIGIE